MVDMARLTRKHDEHVAGKIEAYQAKRADEIAAFEAEQAAHVEAQAVS